MGDAMTDSAHMALESKAEDLYAEALLNFLNETDSKKREVAIKKMNEYAEIFRGSNILKELRSEFQKLEENDEESWKWFSKNSEKTIFLSRPDLKKVFLLAAQKRGIGSMQWVV
jgi:hypothetical protein